MAKNPLIRSYPKRVNKPLPNKSAGILDDYAVRKVVATKEGSITRAPTDEFDLVNKKYVDNLIRGNIDLFLTNNASDIGGYKDMETAPVTDAKETLTQTITANSTTLIEEFASKLNEEEIDNINLLKSGVYTVHIHSSANFLLGMTIFYEFYKRTAGGTETLLGTSHDSDTLTTSEAEYELHASIASDTDWTSGDRVVIKIYGRNNNAASKDVSLFVENDTVSRVEILGSVPQGGTNTVTVVENFDTGWINRSDWTNVHMGSNSTKNVDSNVTHSLGVPLSDILVKVLISTDGTDANSFEVASATIFDNATGLWGITLFNIDNNNILVQTGSFGLISLVSSGSHIIIDTEDWYYKIKVYKIA